MLPQITKTTNMKKFDIDLSMIREDPLFGDFRMKSIPKRLTPLDGKLNFKDIISSTRGKNATEMGGYTASKQSEKKDTLDLTTPGPAKEVDAVAAAQQALVLPNAHAAAAKAAQQALAAAEEREKELQAKVRTLERDLQKVTDKLAGIKKDNQVKLTQAKEVAQKKANDLIAQKIKACSDAYKNEFETLAV